MISALLQGPFVSLLIKTTLIAMVAFIVLFQFLPRVFHRLPPGLRSKINNFGLKEMQFTFLAGCYQVVGGLGGGKSYNSTMYAARLAAVHDVPLVMNYPATPFLNYALRRDSMRPVETHMIQVWNEDDPWWYFNVAAYNERYKREILEGKKEFKFKGDISCVIVIDELLFYFEIGAVKKLIISNMTHARKRGQIVWLISQADLGGRIVRLLRFTIMTEYWFPVNLFVLKLKDPRKLRGRFSNLRTYRNLRDDYWSKSYDSHHEFTEPTEHDRAEKLHGEVLAANRGTLDDIWVLDGWATRDISGLGA
jgi:hypothetical protein